MDDFYIDFMTGGGGGGGGGATIKSGSTPSVESCAAAGNKTTDTNSHTDFATYEPKSNLCVTKFNQQPQTYAGATQTTTLQLGTSSCVKFYSNAYSDNTTAYSAGGPAYSYSGKMRLVCTYSAAPEACSYLASKTGDPWELPNNDILAKWDTQQQWRDLHLCDFTSTYYVSACAAPKSTICKVKYPSGDTTEANAYAHVVWSKDRYTNSYELNTKVWKAVNYVEYNFSSVRCVLGSTETFYSLSAGGGGGSPAITNGNAINTTLNDKIKENVGGTIEITAGGGGLGGSAASESAKKAGGGENGKDSCITVKDSSGIVVYRVCTIGGNGGGGADGSSGEQGTGGTAGAEIALNNGGCYYQTSNEGEKTTISCSSVGHAGTAGVSSSSNPSGGGLGGLSNYTTASNTGASYINNVTGTNHDDGTNPGAGGGGGRAISTNSDPGYTLGDGGRGTGGMVVLKYKRKFPGSGGGGGAAGSVVSIPNVYVGKSTICTFVLGEGGVGGEKESVGTAGGSSSIACDTTPAISYAVPGGGGGQIGTSAQTENTLPVGGIGGSVIKPNKLEEIISTRKGSFYPGTTGNNAVESIGGNGGKSGTGLDGGFGGFNDETNQTIMGTGFIYNNIVTPTSSKVTSGSYGAAGAGGGGGSWKRGLGAGKGGDGLGGYVCVYWDSAGGE